MKNKNLFYILFLIGIVSIFLPFDIGTTIHCGFEIGYSSNEQQTMSFLAVFKNVSFHNFKDIIETLLAILLLVPFVFSAILFFYKKYIILIVLNLFPFVFFLL